MAMPRVLRDATLKRAASCLGIWGLKLGMDGGVEGGFLCEPYGEERSIGTLAPGAFANVVGFRAGPAGLPG